MAGMPKFLPGGVQGGQRVGSDHPIPKVVCLIAGASETLGPAREMMVKRQGFLRGKRQVRGGLQSAARLRPTRPVQCAMPLRKSICHQQGRQSRRAVLCRFEGGMGGSQIGLDPSHRRCSLALGFLPHVISELTDCLAHSDIYLGS